MAARADFPESAKRALSARVGNLCSNPECRALTNGPHEEPAKAVNLGVAAYITAAAPGGPRYDVTLTTEQRTSAENAIWLCQSCAKLIDSDPARFSVELLRRWKVQAEEHARGRVGRTARPAPAGATYNITIDRSIIGAFGAGSGVTVTGAASLSADLDPASAAQSCLPGDVDVSLFNRPQPLRPLHAPPRNRDHFVGREEELGQIHRWLVETCPRQRAALVGIHGMGGVGKTALVLRFAEQHVNSFPGGILWGNLGTSRDPGERGSAKNPSEVLRETLLQWEVEMGATCPPERPTSAIFASVRRLMAERIHHPHGGAMLLILDNVDTESTIGPLLEALSEPAILMTTRRIDLTSTDEMYRLKLGGLRRSATITYVQHKLGPTDPRIERIGEILDHVEDHPLAVKLLVGILKADSGVPADQLFRKLRSAPHPAYQSMSGHAVATPKSLEDCFRVSISTLPHGPLKPLLISLASQSPISWPIESADYISGINSPPRTHQLITRLCDAGLVDPVEERRYRIHRLLRDYLRSWQTKSGLGRLIHAGWEVNSIASLLMHLGPLAGLSAGCAVYDSRQVHWFLRYAADNQRNPHAMQRDWDGIVAGMYRGVERGFRHSTRAQVLSMLEYLRGADLSGLRLDRVVLDGACLDGLRLEGADLSGRQLRRTPDPAEALALLSTAARLALAVLCLAGISLVAAGLSISWAHYIRILVNFSWLLPSMLTVPVSEGITRVLLSGGAWFDQIDNRSRALWERFLAGALAVGGATFGSELLPWAHPYILETYRSSILYVAPLSAIIASTCFAITNSMAATMLGGGLGGLGRRVTLAAVNGLGTLALGALGMIILTLIRQMEIRWWGANIVVPFMLMCLSSTIYALYWITAADPNLATALYSVRTSYMRDTSLRRAVLRRASLRWVRLNRANLTAADLSGADLRQADLEAATLIDANLDEADLRGASLRGANLIGCTLTRARLEGADIGESIFDSTTRWPEGFSVPAQHGR